MFKHLFNRDEGLGTLLLEQFIHFLSTDLYIYIYFNLNISMYLASIQIPPISSEPNPKGDWFFSSSFYFRNEHNNKNVYEHYQMKMENRGKSLRQLV